MDKTIYKCLQAKSGSNIYTTAHYARSENEALRWLSAKGGGIYRNTLHNFEFKVKAGEYSNVAPKSDL